MLVDKDGLWYRVLKARYGEEGGRLMDGGGDGSVWWKMICSVCSGAGSGVGSWFEDNVRRVVGGGTSTYFWLDNWVGEAPLRVQFPRRFELSENKGATVKEMAERGWDVGGGAWVWRRRLLAWEEESVLECSSLLCDIVLQVSTLDRWRWVLDHFSGYSVKGTYKYLTLPTTPVETGLYDAAWVKHVPLKVSVFVWCLLRNRLPTKDNLLRRRALHQDDIICVGGCGCQETSHHLFIRCDIFGGLWHRIYQWLDISFIPLELVRDNLHQFGNLAGLPQFTHSFLQVIWHACVWLIWKERNNNIFNHKTKDVVLLLDSVKLTSFLWLKANKLTSAFSYTDWWRDPLLCMGVRD